LFLDEIGDLSPAAQAKLLRVMQEREIQRLGDSTTRKVDVRFLFATHKDLAKMAREGNYREDLFYRVSVYSLVVAPLRERREDIPTLLYHFLAKYSRLFGKSNLSFSPAAITALSDYSWPGNVRELENLIQGILVNADSDSVIDVQALPAFVTGDRSVRKFSGMKLEQARQEFEREFLIQALERNRWNKTHAAQELGITRQGLVNMIQRLGLRKSN
jgi:transcriptional regulator with GAF, ATPase, and Fis domain